MYCFQVDPLLITILWFAATRVWNTGSWLEKMCIILVADWHMIRSMKLLAWLIPFSMISGHVEQDDRFYTIKHFSVILILFLNLAKFFYRSRGTGIVYHEVYIWIIIYVVLIAYVIWVYIDRWAIFFYLSLYTSYTLISLFTCKACKNTLDFSIC